MPMPKLRPSPERYLDPAGEAARVARLAGDGDVPIVSPVHRLQHELSMFERGEVAAAAAADGEYRYPGWFRVAFPVGASAVLWSAIIWGIQALR
ncbi:hypothetical protein [Novosphingobium olei]|uniref:Uncharacterized protein n=1 Tax=Novosphingobium olei TaxID=2728851 RepID=A0A7Y0BN31_9SPHN|nr:hypothetical protein [Novosphingobium olei]NML93223.1 hypothetical protein [Novosphingobium olei]